LGKGGGEEKVGEKASMYKQNGSPLNQRVAVDGLRVKNQRAFKPRNFFERSKVWGKYQEVSMGSLQGQSNVATNEDKVYNSRTAGSSIGGGKGRSADSAAGCSKRLVSLPAERARTTVNRQGPSQVNSD